MIPEAIPYVILAMIFRLLQEAKVFPIKGLNNALNLLQIAIFELSLDLRRLAVRRHHVEMGEG